MPTDPLCGVWLTVPLIVGSWDVKKTRTVREINHVMVVEQLRHDKEGRDRYVRGRNEHGSGGTSTFIWLNDYIAKYGLLHREYVRPNSCRSAPMRH